MIQLALALVLASAIVHAAWNAALRHIKGDFAVMYLGMALGGSLALLVAAIHSVFTLDNQGFTELFSWGKPALYCATSALIHMFYVILLTSAYWYGDLSVIYPIARGSGIAMTALLAQFFAGEVLPQQLSFGVSVIVIGVLCMGVPAGCFSRPCTPDVVGGAIDQDTQPMAATTVGCQSQDTERCFDVSARSCEPSDVCKADGELKPQQVEVGDALVNDQVPNIGNSARASSLPIVPKNGRDMLWGISVGSSIAMYSVADKFGVGTLNASPVVYIGAMNLLMVMGLSPMMVLSMSHLEQGRVAFQSRKRYIAAVGVGGTGCYLTILFAMQSLPVSIVCALRESAVIWSCVLGVCCLHEPFTYQKGIGAILIFIGMLMIELNA